MIDTITYVHTDSLHGLLTTHSLIDSSIIVERAWRGPGAPDSGTQKRGRLSGQWPRKMNQGEIARTMAIRRLIAGWCIHKYGCRDAPLHVPVPDCD